MVAVLARRGGGDEPQVLVQTPEVARRRAQEVVDIQVGAAVLVRLDKKTLLKL